MYTYIHPRVSGVRLPWKQGKTLQCVAGMGLSLRPGEMCRWRDP